MDPGSGDLGEIVYSGLPGNTVGMATMVDMIEASKQKSGLWAQNASSDKKCSLVDPSRRRGEREAEKPRSPDVGTSPRQYCTYWHSV